MISDDDLERASKEVKAIAGERCPFVVSDSEGTQHCTLAGVDAAEVERLRGALAAADDLIDRIIRDEHVVDLGFEAWGPLSEGTRAEGRALLEAYDALRSLIRSGETDV